MSNKKIKINRVKSETFQKTVDPSTGDVHFYIIGGVAEETKKGKIVSDSIKESNSVYIKRPLPLINPGRKPNEIRFMECLDIYENNQDYYRDNINELVKLEKWFSKIPEPYKNGDSWKIRETNRRKYMISDYCDKDIRGRILAKRKCPTSENKTS